MNLSKLTCQELVEMITDYLEAALPDDERARFEAHLAECTGCRNYLGQMRQTIQFLGEQPAEPLPPHSSDELLAIFRSWKQGNHGD